MHGLKIDMDLPKNKHCYMQKLIEKVSKNDPYLNLNGCFTQS